MDIISQFNHFVEENFNKFLKNYFLHSNYWNKSSSINNYISFMNDLDSFNYNFIINVIKTYFEYIDNIFFHSSYRKNFCESKGFIKELFLLSLVKLLLNDDTIMIKNMETISSLLIYF